MERISGNPPAFFERLIVDLFAAMGYGRTQPNAVEKLGCFGDGGVNSIIYDDRLGLDRVYIQAKRYAVGCLDAQGFVGSLVGLDLLRPG